MSGEIQIVIGTAGHIDHGKSRLVMALTGTDPDRLPEEKERGMTIDLGFAHLRVSNCSVWLVDVPGHERFIRNMVAGATGVDAALLVVAADDSVMPQTREHVEVLAMLGVSRCIVAVTKIDLVDAELAELVEAEARELLGCYEIEPVAVVHTSAKDGRGIDELRQALLNVATTKADKDSAPYSWFRLPIDRTFNIPGRGTVVTGSVAHGSVQVEDELELWPVGRTVRVRDLQAHHEATANAMGRMRLAINLASLSLDEVQRGCELASPGYLEPTQRMEVRIAAMRMPGKTVRKLIRLRLHIATSEVLAELRLLDEPAGLEIRGQYGQLRLREPIVASWGQRFILRDESGSRTLGGGVVLRPVARPWTSRRPAQRDGLNTLHEGVGKARLEEVVRANEWAACPPALLATRAGLPDERRATALCDSLVAAGRIVRLQLAASRTHVHMSHIDSVADGVAKRLATFLADNPRSPGVPRGEWPGWMPRACLAKWRPVLADWLIDNERVALAGGFVVPLGHAGAMSPQDQQLLDAVLGELHEAAFQPPAIKSLACVTDKNRKRADELVDLAAARGQLVRLADGIWLHGEHWQEAVRLVSEATRDGQGVTVAQIRTLLDSSRKYVVPIAELLDAEGITRRAGDERFRGPKADKALS